MNPQTQNDPDVVNMAKAIIQHESGGNFNAKGASGESGVAQWLPATWSAQAKSVLGDTNAPMTPNNQKAVLYASIKQDKDSGLNPAEIAAKWNSGSPTGWENKIGTNAEGVKYNVPQYVKAVTDLYQQYKNGSQTQTPQVQNASTNSPAPLQSGVPGQPSNIPARGNAPSLQNIKNNLAQTPQAIAGATNAALPILGDIGGDFQGTNKKTGLQQLGDAGTSALTASMLIPGLDIGSLVAEAGLKGGAGIAARIGGNALLGAGFGASGALGSGQTNPSQIAKSAAETGLLGGGLGAAGEALGGAVSKVASRNTGDRLTQQTSRLKTLDKVFKENSRPATATSGATNPITTLLENKTPEGKPFASLFESPNGSISSDALTNQNGTGAIDNAIETHSEEASNLVKQLKGGVPIAQFKAEAEATLRSDPTIRGTLNLPKALATLDSKLASAEMSYGKILPYEAIDEIRAGMNKVYDPTERDVARIIGDTSRKFLYNGDGTNTALRSAMANEAEMIRARNFAQKIHGTKVPGGQLGKYFADLVGATAGHALGALGGPVGAAAGTVGGGVATNAAMNLLHGMYFNPLGSASAKSFQGLIANPLIKSTIGGSMASLLRNK